VGKSLLILATLLGLAACQPPQPHVALDGTACKPVGYSWAPIWMDPRTGRACGDTIGLRK
jgi:hypothetical protein